MLLARRLAPVARRAARWQSGFLSNVEFVRAADEVLEKLCDDFNDVADDHESGGGFDVSLGDGVLNLTIPVPERMTCVRATPLGCPRLPQSPRRRWRCPPSAHPDLACGADM